MKCHICDREYVAFRVLATGNRFWACPVHNRIIDGTHKRADEDTS